MASGSLKATPESRLNCFRVCRITLDHVPQVLRNIFLNRLPKWNNSPADGNWFLQNERWMSKLSQEMKSKIQQGNSNNWDSTVLFHILLFSSHCLLANKVPGTQGSLQTGSKMVKATLRSADFRRYVVKGSTVLFDLGGYFFRAQVTNSKPVCQRDFFVSKVFNDHSTYADVYVCTVEWQLLEELSHLRNEKFAHVDSCSTTNKDLKIFVQDLTKIYHQLKVPKQLITDMQSMATEIVSDGQVICTLQKYERLLLEEQSYWYEVRHELEDIHYDLDAVIDDVQKLHEVQPQLIADIKTFQSDLAGMKKEVDVNYENFSKELQGVESQTHSAQEEMKTLGENFQIHSDMLEASSTAFAELRTQSGGLAQRMSVQGKELRNQLQSQKDFIQHDRVTLNVLQDQQRNTAARVGHQASRIQNLELKEKETEKKINTVQSEMKYATEHQEILQEGVLHMSNQLNYVTRQLSSTLIEVKDIQSSLQSNDMDTGLEMLEPSFFDTEIAYYSNKYHQGTRLWIIEDISNWVLQSLPNTSRVCLITANAGMGKSVIAGKLCYHFYEQGILGGCFFFQHNKARRSNPVSVIHTMAYFLCYNVPLFKLEFMKHMNTLSSKVSLNNIFASSTVAELFTLLILEPIGKIASSDVKVFVIDALDECGLSCHSEMVKLILREFSKLPNWMSVVITSRANETIRKLKQIRPRFHLDPNDKQNLNDIKCFLMSILVDRMDSSLVDGAVSLLIKKSEGLFLYFHYLVQVLLEKKVLTIQLLEEILPEGIDDYYDQNFHRLHAQLQQYYHPLLSALVATRSGLPIGIIPEILSCSPKICTDIIQALSVIFPTFNNTIKLFHASIKDWITDPKEAEELVVSVKLGHQILTSYSKDKLLLLMDSCPTEDDILSNELAQFVIRNAIYHGSRIQECCHSVDVCQWLTDIQFLYYHILVCHGITELLQAFDYAKSILHLVPPSMQKSTKDCEVFIQKHTTILSDNPLLIFQLALNEGDSFQYKVNMARINVDPKKVFHRLKSIVVQKKPFAASPGLVTCIPQPLPVNCCRISKDDTVVTTCSNFSGFKGILCLWNKKNETPINLLQINIGREVECFDISPDQKLIACGGISCIYNFLGEKIDLLDKSGPIESRNCSLFSPKMDTLLCWDTRVLPYFTNVIELWNLQTCSRIILDETKDKEERALCACYSSDGSSVVTGHVKGMLKVWNCKTGTLQQVIHLPILYLPDSNARPNAAHSIGMQGVDINTQVCASSSAISFTITMDPGISTADALKTIKESCAITPVDGEKLGSMSKQESNHITSCIFSPNGHFLLASKNLKLHIYDAKTYELIESEEISVPKKHQNDYINAVCCAPDCQYVVAATYSGTIWWWKYTSRISSQSAKYFSYSGCIHEQGSGLYCTFDKDYHLLVGNNDELRIYDFQVFISSPKSTYDSVHGNYVSCCATISCEQGTFITSGDQKVCLWSSANSKIIKKQDDVETGDFLYLSPNKDIVALYGTGPIVELRDLKSLDCFERLVPKIRAISPNTACYYCCISSEKIVACGYESGHILIFHGLNLENSLVLEGHEGEVRWLCFSSDGLILVSGDDKGIVFMWHLSVDDVKSVQCSSMNPLDPHEDCVQEVHFSPVLGKMSRVASCSFDGNVHLYHGSTGVLIHQITAIKPFCLHFSPYGETFAVGSNDGKCYVYDGFTGDLLVVLKLHSAEAEVTCIAFTEIQDKQYLITGYHHSLHVWNPVTGECLTMLPLSNVVMFVEVCQKDTLIVGTYSGHVHVLSMHVYE